MRVLLLASALLPAACSLPSAYEGTVVPPAAALDSAEWRFGTREHVAVWYHALSFVLPGQDSLPLPIYQRSERDSALAAARRAGIARTPVELAADSLAREFAGSSRYDQLQFLPLYFDNADALFNGIELWRRVEGEPQRAGSAQGAEAVALLSNMFSTPRQRYWVAEFARLVQAERTAWFSAWWRERERRLAALADSASIEWERLREPLEPLLHHLQVRGGEVLLTPSLGREGRTVTTRTLLRSAVGAGAGTLPGDVALEVLHELMYLLVPDVVQEYVAPAVLRDLGEDVVASRAAARAGLLVLERVAPERAARYRLIHLRAAGRSGTDAATFRATFPLPAELERALTQRIEEAIAGI